MATPIDAPACSLPGRSVLYPSRVLAIPIALRRALYIALVWRLLIAIVGIAAFYLVPRGRFTRVSLIHAGPHWPANPLTVLVDSEVRSDSAWYGQIAMHGYGYSTHHLSGIAFYPLYPLLVRAVSFVVGTVWIAGPLVSMLCLLGAVVALYQWLDARNMGHLTPRVTLLLLLFPWSLFYAAMYSESLYLCIALATFAAVERRRPYLAALFACLLVLSRPTGIIVAPCLVILLWERRERDLRAWLAPLAAGAALAGFAVYQWFLFGTPWAAEQAQTFQPWSRTLHQGLMDLTLHRRPGIPPFFLALLLLVGIAVLLTVPSVHRHLGAPYALFTVLSIIVPAATGLISLERFAIVAFPIFVVSASKPIRAHRIALLTIQVWLLILFTAGFEAGWSVW